MTISRTNAPGSGPSWRGEVGDNTYRKVTRRLLPILIALCVLAHIGRSNLGRAALTVNRTGNQYAGFYIIAALMLPAGVVLAKSVRNERLRAQKDLALAEVRRRSGDLEIWEGV